MKFKMGRRQFLQHTSMFAGLAFAGGIPALAAEDGVVTWNEPIPTSLDAHLVVTTAGQFVVLNIYDTLYRYVGNPAELVPWLAVDHAVSEDGLTWTINIRDDVKFHSGNQLTAEDVVFSFQRVLAVGGGYSVTFRPVLKPENIEATSPTVVTFRLDRPYAPFFPGLATIAIMDSKKIRENEKDGDWGKEFLSNATAGSGAYRLREGTYRPLEAMEIEQYPDHFKGIEDNSIKLARLRYIKEPSTELLAILKGDLDVTLSYLGPEQAEKIQGNDTTYLATVEGMRAFNVRLHNQRAPFNNLHFRRALSHAFNYEGVIDGIVKGQATRVNQPLSANIWGNDPDITGYNYDMEKAQEEMAKAKETGVEDLDREIKIYTDPARQVATEISQIFQSDLRKLGLRSVIVPSLFQQSAALTANPETAPDIWMHHTSAYFVDPENWIGQMYHSSMHGTWKGSSWYKNPKVDELLDAARSEMDQEKRRVLYQEASGLIVEDAADIWVYNPLQIRGLTKRITTFVFCPIGEGGELRSIKLG